MGRPSTNRTETLRLSMDIESKKRLRLYATQKHTNISQLITTWIWEQDVKMPDEIPDEEKT